MRLPDAEVFLPCVETPTRLILTSKQNGQHLCASKEMGVVSLSTRKEEWFWIHQDEATCGLLKSAKHGFYLAMELGTVKTQEEATMWRMIKKDGRMLIQLEAPSSHESTSDGSSSSTPHESSPETQVVVNHANNCDEWQMECLTGELCFMHHPQSDCRMRCDVVGQINMGSNWKGWEVFRFIAVHDYYIITSWTHTTRALATNDEGRVFTTDRHETKKRAIQYWKITKAPDNSGLWIESESFPGRFLSFIDRTLSCVKNECGTDLKKLWHLEPANRRQFYISNPFQDKRLSSTYHGALSVAGNRKEWEEWSIEKLDGGFFVIQSVYHQGRFLAYDRQGKLATSETPERWQIEESPHGGVVISGVGTDIQISCCNDGTVRSASNSFFGKSETWHLEPIMPSSTSGRNLAVMAGTVAAAAIVAPFAATAIVSALGFGYSGIAAGSVGAGMMSAEATAAAGGAIAAGGAVATLQSVGAAGLGIAGSSAAVGTGVVFGTGIVGGASALGSKKKTVGNSTSTTLRDDAERLPLSSWRWWDRQVDYIEVSSVDAWSTTNIAVAKL